MTDQFINQVIAEAERLASNVEEYPALAEIMRKGETDDHKANVS
ncbi:hypothetical protein [Jeotgalibacillus campisalis]|uniref:Uncharacterized protein n=1 Tax=Jeotgalibacillus campisalis TaxID=220754 RepID=A0A0C2R7F9_9BACL|nr:hypothetical protein [Jeotgalibacillus campisalis]KIL46195.1 hypothetical protein KR50_28700 [Jeotgalibacillus campisalis]